MACLQVLGSLDRTLVIGRRTNLPVSDKSAIHRPADVERMARTRGRLFISNAQDYFLIAGNRFPWHRIPDVVVGRPAYDNFVVAIAIRDGVSVIDATASILAVHQSDRDGNFAGHNNTDRNANVAVIGKYFSYRRGFTSRSQYVTMVTVVSTAASAKSSDASSATSSIGASSEPAAAMTYDVTVHTRLRRHRIYASFWNRLGLTCI
jgi:hypothetical protein